MTSARLSKAQTATLRDLRVAGSGGLRTPATGSRGSGAVASAWYRTVTALYRLGLVAIVREGDGWRAWTVDDAPADWRARAPLFLRNGGRL